ncbi:MAG: uroporphyrinogen decarboxylase family protein [Oscillospiraceae bacterium]|nr:uroporphyrinogen decarboxylase family protein [Oscillospiraceae bacterium]
MNKIERMKAVFANEVPDVTPVGFWFHYPVSLTARESADAHLKLYRELNGDIIKIMDDCFGQDLTHGLKIEHASDWREITLPGRDCPQYRKMEEVIRLLAQEVGEEVMIFPTMWSPFKLASWAYIFGGSDEATFMRHCAEDPDSVAAGVSKIADVLTDWTEGYLQAGASGIYYSGQFSEPRRFIPEVWGRLVRPFDLQVLERAKALGGYTIVHICGEADHGFRSSPERYADYPGDLFNWDVHRTGLSLEEGRTLFCKPILGGLDNHGLLTEGTPEEIAAETRRIIASFGRRGFMLGADCTVPADIDLARLKAAAAAAKE